MDYGYGLGLPEMLLSCSFSLDVNQRGQEVAPTFGWELFACECTFSVGHGHPQPGEFPPGKSERHFGTVSTYLSTQGRDVDIQLG